MMFREKNYNIDIVNVAQYVTLESLQNEHYCL
jgi:hypothetical protein